MNRTAVILLALLIVTTAEAQLVEHGLPFATSNPKRSKAFSRTQALDPTFLPFWDDFSATDDLLRDTLWLYGQSVLLNNGFGIRPPSRNVVTFDGTDSLGKPYNINDVLAKGFADRLTSQPIRMDLVPVAERDSVYISFFYQFKGRGELPDPGDQLFLDIKAQDGTWETIFNIETGPTLETDTFYQVILKISEDRFFHDNFQFRFYNFARLSGPFDTWSVDYVYLNRHRFASDLRYPDRTISSPLSSLFRGYYALPLEHFLEDTAANIIAPSIELYNLLEFEPYYGRPHIQSVNNKSIASIAFTRNDTTTTNVVGLDNGTVVYPHPGLTYLDVFINVLPVDNDFDTPADSINININYFLQTQDNELFNSPDSGDYKPEIYSPIDFRHNDTTSISYDLSSYYAYDDGTSEYGAGLNQAGSSLAIEYTAVIDSVDTMTYVDIYFPQFGDNTNQSLLLQIRDQLTNMNVPPLHEQLIVVNRTTMNQFVRYVLYRPVLVGGTFYVGWKQISNASILVGIDKNTDNGDKIFFNTNGIWEQNTDTRGSLMVRPGFGDGDGTVITAIEATPPAPKLYPNPAPGICKLNAKAQQLEVYDVTGRLIEAQWEIVGNETSITFSPSTSGLVLARMIVDGRVYTQKVIVQGPGR